MGLIPHNSYPHKRGKLDTEIRTEDNMEMELEIGEVCLQAKEHQISPVSPQNLRGRPGTDPPSQSSERTKLVSILILDF